MILIIPFKFISLFHVNYIYYAIPPQKAQNGETKRIDFRRFLFKLFFSRFACVKNFTARSLEMLIFFLTLKKNKNVDDFEFAQFLYSVFRAKYYISKKFISHTKTSSGLCVLNPDSTAY